MIRTILIVSLLTSTALAQDYGLLDCNKQHYDKAMENTDKTDRQLNPPPINIPQQNKNGIIFAPLYQGQQSQGLLRPQFNNYLLLY